MSGTLTNGVAQITLSADASNLSQGHYDCGLIISDGYPSHRPLEATVTLVVHLEGQLHVPQDFKTIQSAIDAAYDGDTVLVADGTYTGNGNRNIDFGGKRITVQSENGPGNCIIDCEGIARGFYFHSNEDANSVLAGFTVTNGYVYNRGGAIYCRDSSPTLNNCRFIGNSTGGHGGAVKNSDSSPLLINCVFIQNRAVNFGGAMENYESNPILIECTFSGNSAKSSGAMYNYESNPTLTDCTFSSNRAKYGGGIYNDNHSSPHLANCIFSGNWADEYGGAIHNWNSSNPTLANCTFSGNSAGNYGGALCSQRVSNPKVTNCIMWDNTAPQGDNIYLALYSWAGNTYTTAITVSYSDVEGGESGAYVETGCTLNWGEGNIDADPLFVEPGYRDVNDAWIEGDYHLLPNSPSINAGDPDYIPSLGETDIDGEPRVMGGRVDMGADEFTSTLTPILRIWPTEFLFSSYEDGPNPQVQILSIRNIGSGTLNWEIAEDCPWLEVYPANGQSTGQVNEVTLSVDISGLAPGSYNCQLTIAAEGAVNSPQVVLVTLNLGGSELYVPSEYDTIQAAIDAAIDWDTVIVEDGIYGGNGNRDIDFLGKVITVRSENGPGKCIIDCNGTEAEPHRGFYFHNAEGPDSIVAGITITRGYIPWAGPFKYNGGGAISCEQSNPTLINCIFMENSVEHAGGAIFNNNSSPTVSNCIFRGNLAYYGGGMWNMRNSRATITNCTFRDNLAIGGGGGVWSVSGSSPTIKNCDFTSNSAVIRSGGAIFCGQVEFAIISNCTLVGNSAGGSGGGVVCFEVDDVAISNCTATGNSASRGNALVCDSPYQNYPSNVELTNCILWDGGDEIWNNDGSSITISYTDLHGGEIACYDPCDAIEWDLGNIDADPCFVDPGYWGSRDDPNIVVEPNDPNALWIDGDYHLLGDSPCIDAGDPNYVPEPNATDLDGKPRVIGGRIDMGAYEYSPTIPAEVRIVPRSINLTSKGKWITCYIWLPEDCDVADIEPNSVFLEDEIQAESFRVDEQQQVAMARFSRSEVQGILNPPMADQVEVTITGELIDGTVFEGTDIIRVIDKGKKK